MDATSELRLLLRFYKDVFKNTNQLLQKFEISAKEKSNDYAIKVKGNHIWISL